MFIFMLKMGLWSKVKGVFGRIGHGIKSGWDWLTTNRDKIAQAAEAVSDIIPGAAGDKIKQGIAKGEQLYGRAEDIMDKYGKYL